MGTERKIIEYAIGGFNGAGINVGDDNEHKDVAGRIVVSPVHGLSIGIDRYQGKSGAAKDDKIRTGGELAYVISSFSLKGEYVTGKDAAIKKHGWYGMSREVIDLSLN